MTKIYDALCTRCGAELDFPDVAIAPESWERVPAGQPRVLTLTAGGAREALAVPDFGCPKPDSAGLMRLSPTLAR